MSEYRDVSKESRRVRPDTIGSKEYSYPHMINPILEEGYWVGRGLRERYIYRNKIYKSLTSLSKHADDEGLRDVKIFIDNRHEIEEVNPKATTYQKFYNGACIGLLSIPVISVATIAISTVLNHDLGESLESLLMAGIIFPLMGGVLVGLEADEYYKNNTDILLAKETVDERLTQSQ